jgi:hypothetical protein
VLNKRTFPPYHFIMRLRFLVPLIAVAIASSSRPSSASLVMALDLETMVSRADNVAVVDVTSVTAAWDDRHEQILSTITLTVVESWKGTAAPATRVVVVQPGGAVGDIVQTVHGMTRFTPGERAVVFLQGSAQRAHVVGMAQGKRLIRRDVGTGRFIVHAPDRAGATFVRTAPASGTSPVFDMRARPLDDLRTEVRALATKTGGAR